jgi:hypothetical protein
VSVAFGAAVLEMIWQPARSAPLPEPLSPASAPAQDTDTQPQRPGTWSLRAGGWYIRVDGADVPIPSVDDLTTAPPRAGLSFTISPFDRLIAYHAEAEGFDWRLIAALIFEESGFNPASRSDKGAVGLMQVRPVAAEAVGAVRFETPADNVQTGTRYLRQLDEMFAAAQPRERLGIILAAYNIGPGHVRDAQVLAHRFGYDPNRWENALDVMLPLLEQPAVYSQLPNGFGRGSETVAYVQRILERYRRYRMQTVTSADPGAGAWSEGATAND